MNNRYHGSKDDRGKPHGKGRYNWNDGSSFEGNFDSGNISQGVYMMPNGNVFCGTFTPDGKKNGHGTFYWANGDIYEGDFVDDKIDGVGTYWYSNGDKYWGEWNCAQREGKGIVYIHATGSFFHCIWGNNQPREGIWINKWGHIYEGTFLNRQMHGTGIYTWPNGRSKYGEFRRGALKQQTTKVVPDHIPKWTIPKSFLSSRPSFVPTGVSVRRLPNINIPTLPKNAIICEEMPVSHKSDNMGILTEEPALPDLTSSEPSQSVPAETNNSLKSSSTPALIKSPSNKQEDMDRLLTELTKPTPPETISPIKEEPDTAITEQPLPSVSQIPPKIEPKMERATSKRELTFSQKSHGDIKLRHSDLASSGGSSVNRLKTPEKSTPVSYQKRTSIHSGAPTPAPSNLEKFYEIKHLLGEGVSSQVFLAQHRKTEKYYAVKKIPKKILVNNSDLAREVKILQQLKHPNIIQLVDVFVTTSELQIVMELAEGSELFEEIVNRKTFSENDAKHIIRNILEGVAYIHSLGIVHRDLKPENIIWMEHPETHQITLKIIDFGFARNCNEEQIQNTPAGTLGYKAPEILNLEPYTTKADMWSIGVIAYILLCGFPPFFSCEEFKDTGMLLNAPFWIFFNEQTDELLKAIKTGDYGFPETFWGKLSNESKDFISLLLKVDLQDRISAEEALSHDWFKTEGDVNLGDAFPVLQKYREVTNETKLKK